MIVKQFSFSENLVKIATDEIEQSAVSTNNMLIIAPSKRFLHYLANSLFEKYNGRSFFFPDFITSDEMIANIISNLTLPTANSSEQIKAMIRAIKNSDDYEKIIPNNSFESYNGAISGAKTILKLFGEILKNKIPDSISSFLESIKNSYQEPYKGFKEHINTLISISENYEKIQEIDNNYDPSFLIPKITKNEIEEFFKHYRKIILISPTALTTFEKNIYSTIDSKLTVITQNCEEYDFSSIKDWPEINQKKIVEQHLNKTSGKIASEKIFYSEEPSLLYEVSKILNIIKLELEKGTKSNDILILNIDNILSEILFDSLNSYDIPLNLSQGISIKREPLYQLFSSIAEFFQSKRSNALIKILTNQIFSDFSKINIFPNKIRLLKDKILNENIHIINNINNRLFNEFPEIKRFLKELNKLYTSKDAGELYLNLNQLILEIGSKRSYELNTLKELIEEAIVELSILQDEINDNPFNIFLSILSSKKLPYIGSFREGIQILGLLETRGISFKTVIIPSFNEGIFPSPSQEYRIINSALRKSIGLPNLYQQEELEFFYLKRLIDSSENCYILSLSSDSSKNRAVDIPSRYTYFFEKDKLQRINNEYIIPVKQAFTYYNEHDDIDVPKLNETIFKFSRLDVDRIKKCQTMYYIAKILHIQDEQMLAEEIDVSIIGTIIHNIFYELYKDIKTTNIHDFGRDQKDNLTKNIEILFEKYLGNNLFYTEETELVKRIIKDICINILENDIKRIDEGYRICNRFSESELNANIGNSKYLLNGRIDRVDKTPSGKYMIIDYKTGTLPSIKSHKEEDNFKQIQLGVYGILFKKNYPEYLLSSLCYYDIKNGKIVEIIKEESIDSYLNHFENHLLDLLEEINNSRKFNLTEDPENCRYCPFKSICRILES